MLELRLLLGLQVLTLLKKIFSCSAVGGQASRVGIAASWHAPACIAQLARSAPPAIHKCIQQQDSPADLTLHSRQLTWAYSADMPMDLQQLE